MSNFVTELRSGRVLLMDGAMGTELRRHASNVECGEHCNLSQPDLVRSIHRSYVEAGAEVLLTNTFQANPAALASRVRQESLHNVWAVAIALARAERPRFLIADVGPVEDCTWEVAASMMAECKLVDGLLLETWSSIDALKRFANQRGSTSVPLLISFTFHRTSDLRTVIGARPEECAAAAAEYGAVAIGANCGKEIGMNDMLEIVKRYRIGCALPVFVRPNAGSPSKAGLQYPRTPAAMAAALSPLLDAGVTMVGGCCGTTPEHIRQFRDVIDEWQRSAPRTP
jgi:methionine synthase I (cobalamin-dependent)